MIVLDSSGWLEYFAYGPQADKFEPVVEDPFGLIVPSLTIYEVYKLISLYANQRQAKLAVAQMRRSPVVDLDDTLAVSAARLSIKHKLSMADAVILATARAFNAELWTMDADFQGIVGVKFIPK
jgi:predicted nucleic acid-binding protein